jgi:uncharacterized SAM-binding protein YcdF (DUF218 family)
METLARIILDLLMPGSQLMILAVLIVIFFWTGRQEWAKRTCLLFLFLFLVYSTPFLPRHLAWQLERQYPVWAADEPLPDILDPVPVMVLTAGMIPDTTLHESHQLNSATFTRLMEGVRVYRTLKSAGSGANLVLSGSAPEGVPTTLAQVKAVVAKSLGVHAQNIHLHDPPGIIDTCTEARVFAERFGEGHRVIVVTSALHMSRAMWWFRHHGLEPVAAPTDFQVRKDLYNNRIQWKPSVTNIRLMERVLQERAGMVWARMSGC